ncbi:hypothetical protein TNCV_4592911 [Trichonephila clavipes]|nr:hypothetical protein TNCV_4592911 [Trichonephila clavipes]
MNLHRYKLHDVRSGERGGPCDTSFIGRLFAANPLVIFNESRFERCQYGGLAAKWSYLIHFLPIEEIAIVVEHQNGQNQLRP